MKLIYGVYLILADYIVILIITFIIIFAIKLSNKNKHKCQQCCNKSLCKEKTSINKFEKSTENSFTVLQKRRLNLKMDEINKSIACTVNDCKNHCKNRNFCSLDKIEIQSHKANPNACENVDCKSFEKEL